MGKILLTNLYCIVLVNMWWIAFAVESMANTGFAAVPAIMTLGLALAFVGWCIENWNTGE